jgi:aryl-phospho-beta-D-glucosidase BglC (GH1 family)
MEVIMLKTNGKYIVDETGKRCFIRGFNLGTWLNLEHFMTGFPGAEQQLRRFFSQYAGVEKAQYFFDGYINAFVQEDDIKYLKSIGCTGLRVPFNYRHFEDDETPFKYKDDGFRYLDRLVQYAKKYNVYLIFDMHSVQGHQNHDWHSDNYTAEKNLYDDGGYQKRFFQLWQYIADHYKSEEIIAGYDIMNEPTAIGRKQELALNKIYREAVKYIREVDKKHILFIKGNMWGRHFESFEDPFDDNVVYSPHLYTGGEPFNYPGDMALDLFNKEFLKGQMNARDWFMKKNNVPCWIGEFGTQTDPDSPSYESRKCFVADLLDIYNEREHSWSYWSYKDIGFAGMVAVKPDSPWMDFTKEVRMLKKKFHCDYNTGDEVVVIKALLEPELLEYAGRIKQAVMMTARWEVAAILVEQFAKDFAGLSYNDIDGLVNSFQFDNCIINRGFEEVIKKRLEN